MIDRYKDQTIENIWCRENQFLRMVQVLSLNPHVDQGLLQELMRREDIRTRIMERWRKKERETHHDVAALVDVLEDYSSTVEGKAKIAYGLTSSDIVDTATFLHLRDSCSIVLTRLVALFDAIHARAEQHAATVMVGRTHGQYADLTTFGHKLANFFYELSVARRGLLEAQASHVFGMLSGPVGTCTHRVEGQEENLRELLTMRHIPISTQVISRVHITSLLFPISCISSILNKWAINFRLMMQHGVDELTIRKPDGAKGSSSMPHKTNPIAFEKISGLHRVISGLWGALQENIALWGERDISNSSAERVILPDIFHAIAHMISTFTSEFRRLEVQEGRMREHATQCPASFRNIHLLIDQNIQHAHACTRHQAYEISREANPYGETGVDNWLSAHKESILNQVLAIINAPECAGD